MRALIFLLAFAISTPVLSAETLGRLFFTPEQRALLDNARKQKIKLADEPETPAAQPAPPPPPPEDMSVNGLVTRSDGGSTVWINNKTINGKSSLPGGQTVTSVESTGKVTVRLRESRDNVEMKVGQRFDGQEGEIKEHYAKSRSLPKGEGILVPRTAARSPEAEKEVDEPPSEESESEPQ